MTHVRMLRLTAGVFLLSLGFCLKFPDQQLCGDEQTGCQIHTGEFNCCPFNQGECCDDHLHCCPEGMLCDVKVSGCTNATHSLSWAERFPPEHTDIIKAVGSSLTDVPCDDTTACADGTTCCKDQQGGWDCCPLPQAVCCDDFIHCCPHGTTCDLAVGSCDNSSVSVPWLTKEPSRRIGGQNVPETERTSGSDVPCDDTSACADGTTCCKNQQGGWSCCPLPQAVCCDDFIHCCPHGTTCDLAVGSCDNSSVSVPWLTKEPSRRIGGQKVPETERTSGSDVPCDDTSACADGTTCCKNQQGGWSCCPLPQAVCCEDFLHCCPHGTTCDLAAGSCDNSSSPAPSLIVRDERVPKGSVPWLKKEPSRPAVQTAQNTSAARAEVKCDPHTCPVHTTCCFMQKRQEWGCCPLDQATCCADGENCCPKGYTCRDQRCVKSSWTEHDSADAAVRRVRTDIDCGGGFSCKDTETCCRTSQSSWGCCPFLKSVCCSDMQHCCPDGYTCDYSGSCTPALGFDWEMLFSKKKKAHTL